MATLQPSFTPTISPSTYAPTAAPTLSGGEIAAATILSVFAAVAFCAVIVYCMCFRRQSDDAPGHTAVEYPSSPLASPGSEYSFVSSPGTPWGASPLPQRVTAGAGIEEREVELGFELEIGDMFNRLENSTNTSPQGPNIISDVTSPSKEYI